MRYLIALGEVRVKNNIGVHFSSNTYEWATPQGLFDELNSEFNFTLDPCATKQNAKCKKFYTKEEDGLSKDWSGERVFMNPPYGRVIAHWVHKAYMETKMRQSKDTLVVCLLPARTDTRWFHNYCLGSGMELRSELPFLKGRLKFGGSKNSAPFPSMVVIFNSVI